ncbi:MAG: type II secretion system protein [Pirellulales bacterium]|nr:type II secretion system protein [Pirellulales bacterium]
MAWMPCQNSDPSRRFASREELSSELGEVEKRYDGVFQQADRGESGFTLFEVIVAIALSAVLLSLIGTAITLYLTRVEADRTRVEEAQLARSILGMIADDIRAASIYQPQDTTAIAQLMAAGTPFDVDTVDAARKASGLSNGVGTPGGVGGPSAVTALSSGSSANGSSSSASGSASSASGAMAANQESEEEMPLGLTGTEAQLYIDVTRLPKQDELFGTLTGYTNAPNASATNAGATGASVTAANVVPPADLKTVAYFVRSGATLEPGSAAATSLATADQELVGGLVRQVIPRGERVFAEQSGSGDVLNSGAVLVAPEVVQIQFSYFDGTQLATVWEMKEMMKLPRAIEVCIWLRSARPGDEQLENTSPDAIANARIYRQVVNLPMSELSASGAEMTDDSTSSSSTSESTTSGTGTGTGTSGSAFEIQ